MIDTHQVAEVRVHGAAAVPLEHQRALQYCEMDTDDLVIAVNSTAGLTHMAAFGSSE